MGQWKEQYRAAKPGPLDRIGHRLLGRPAIARIAAHVNRSTLLPRTMAEALFGDRLIAYTDPGALTHRAPATFTVGGRPRRLKDYWSAPVDWTGAGTCCVAELAVHRFVTQVMAAGDDWRRTALYDAYAASIGAGHRPYKRLTSMAALDAYCEHIVRLVSSIERHGFLRHGDIDWPGTRPGERQVGIAIDAGGRMVFAEKGNHRLAIAHALGLTQIPVQIMFVDRAWLDSHPGRTLLHRAEAFLAALRLPAPQPTQEGIAPASTRACRDVAKPSVPPPATTSCALQATTPGSTHR